MNVVLNVFGLARAAQAIDEQITAKRYEEFLAYGELLTWPS